ncbi:MAG TPA: biopolymer transporter ExbD, partial [Hyphomicrobium sp.]|nr:biopolymer transporter ExbD [Hyphomicrobium sp.]
MGMSIKAGGGGRRRRGRGRGHSPMSEINVTPMVDVMLVLLIIFMVVTPTLMAGFQAEMPKGVNLLQKPDDEE